MESEPLVRMKNLALCVSLFDWPAEEREQWHERINVDVIQFHRVIIITGSHGQFLFVNALKLLVKI